MEGGREREREHCITFLYIIEHQITAPISCIDQYNTAPHSCIDHQNIITTLFVKNFTISFSDKPEGGKGGPSLFVIIIALVCIVALMLPQQDDIGTRLPDYLQLSVPQKLIAAYILGKCHIGTTETFVCI